jgi:predicted cation transporter
MKKESINLPGDHFSAGTGCRTHAGHLRRLDMDVFANFGLLIIFALVLILPFRVKCIEHNLEAFLFACGVAALTIAGFMTFPGEQTGWSLAIVTEALLSPLNVASFFGIPLGIVQIVLLVGLIIHVFYHRLQEAIVSMVGQLSLQWIVFALIVILGLVSSIISAILAAIILVEIVNALPVVRKAKVEIAVVACFSIGLGAGLTPLGEPLSTIVISKLSGAPYHAGFTYLFEKLGWYILPTIIVLGFVGVFLFSRSHSGDEHLECIVERETVPEILVRAGKVYLFIMALVFLGEGFKPLILEYVIMIPSAGLYWINIVSAVLDNATLAAAEISPALSSQQITSALMGLLIAGGMLIPGNIPNIIAACKLGISSSEWARVGIPLGMALMLSFFVIIFVPGWLGFV